ncbi:MAG: YdeI/OmpD-associated family protein [Candidatus Aminicenantaceae bacterium]
MDIGKTLYVTDRKDWRDWLARNHMTESEIWLVYYRKLTGKPRIPYNDAVEEALCYGWIDSQQKGIDEERFAQRFSPRRPKSALSEMNRERIRRLIEGKKMTASGLEAVAHVFDAEKDREESFTIAPDILHELKMDNQAWANFQQLPEGYKKVRIGFIESRRRHGEEVFQKSLRHFIKMTAKNKSFGMLK